jgi:hypothetical protein
MSELTIGHFLLYAVLIVATMATLDWRESNRTRTARAHRAFRKARHTKPARKAA